MLAALYAGLTTTVVATVAPYVDRATSHSLENHIRAGYPSYSQARIDKAVTTYEVILTVIGILGVAGWTIVIRAFATGNRWTAPLATAALLLGLRHRPHRPADQGHLRCDRSVPAAGCLRRAPRRACSRGLLAVTLLHRTRRPKRVKGDDQDEADATGRELEPFLGSFPPASLTDPVTAREQLAALVAVAPPPDTTGMEIEDHVVAGRASVPVRIYRPRRAHGAIVWLHGGGFVMGDLETEHPWAVRIAESSGATVVSVDYRRAPEERFPAALMTPTPRSPGRSRTPRRSGSTRVGSPSVAMLPAQGWRPRSPCGRVTSTAPTACFQLLSQPELDDRQQTWSARNFTDTPFMTREKVSASWQHYLGSAPASPYAAPARADDLGNLPSAYIACAEFDPNRDEAIEYAQRLLQAGVSVELHQWSGTFHGSQAILSADVSQRQIAELGSVLRRALAAA